MGLRFRKSVSLFPGVKLNFGTTGMSVSTGVPGFRKTFQTSGRVTTSVGIPGTGLYYVDTKNTKKQSDRRTSQTQLSSCAPCWDSGCSPQQWLPAPALPGVPPERSWP